MQLCAIMVTFDCATTVDTVDPTSCLAVWSTALMRPGDQSVITCGQSVTLMWPVFSLGSQYQVWYTYTFVDLQSLTVDLTCT